MESKKPTLTTGGVTIKIGKYFFTLFSTEVTLEELEKKIKSKIEEGKKVCKK